MDTSEFLDVTAPSDLIWALEPIAPPPGFGACADYHPERFDSRRRQQAAFDGEAYDEGDYATARALCQCCPILEMCGQYADMSRDHYSFLAGITAQERAAKWVKHTEILKRRVQVERLIDLAAPTSVVAELVGRDPSLIRGDLRIIRHRIDSVNSMG
ncbi:WhiB family transcriptional regulator [Nocardia sp. NPDC057272]|uniref:WhiB family transcriptional regulator n=1 Tax=Nocardia sp. NPDC057272 TaxID=3346079 RepID=UPI003638B837